MKKTICAVDLGYGVDNCTTIVHGTSAETLDYCQIYVDEKLYDDSRTSKWARFDDLAKRAVSEIRSTKFDTVFIEAPAFGAKFGASDMAAFGALIRCPIAMDCRENDKSYFDMPILTWKKFITGSGANRQKKTAPKMTAKQKKQVVVNAVKAIGFDTNDHNLADAVSMFLFGLALERQYDCEPWRQLIADSFLIPKVKKKRKRKKKPVAQAVIEFT